MLLTQLRTDISINNDSNNDKKIKTKPANKLRELVHAADGVSVWHSPDKKTYLTQSNGLSAELNQSREYFGHLYFMATDKGLSKPNLDEALATLNAIALFVGAEHQVYHQVARVNETIYHDLNTSTGEAIEIDAAGWRVVARPPVKFVRCPEAKPLPRPERGGTIEDLKKFTCLDDANFKLFMGSTLDAMKGHGDYLCTAIKGEHASAKSTTLELISRIVNPVVGDLASSPKSEKDLAIDCGQQHYVAYDNLSKFPDWLSDALCRVATGGSVRCRALYTDDQRKVLSFCNPVGINGIADLMDAPDLNSRAARINVSPIDEAQRKDKGEFWTEVDEALPKIMGCLYSAMSYGLKAMPSVRLPNKPRMTSTAKWIAACFPFFGWTYEDWYVPYDDAQREVGDLLADGSLPATLLRRWFAARNEEDWKGTLTELHHAILEECPPHQERWFPATAKKLGNDLRQFAPVLRRKGLDYFRGPKKERYNGNVVQLFHVRKIDTTTSPETKAQGEEREEMLPQPEERQRYGNSCGNTQNAIKQGENCKMLPLLPQNPSLLEQEKKEREKDRVPPSLCALDAGCGSDDNSRTEVEPFCGNKGNKTKNTPCFIGESVLPQPLPYRCRTVAVPLPDLNAREVLEEIRQRCGDQEVDRQRKRLALLGPKPMQEILRAWRTWLDTRNQEQNDKV